VAIGANFEIWRCIFKKLIFFRKCNGTKAEIAKVIDVLNAGGAYPTASEVFW
jgi:hypothetical protein